MSDGRAAEVWAWLRDDPRRFDLAVAALTAGFGTVLVLQAPERFDTGWPEVAAGVGAFVLLVLRRRWPRTLLAIALVATAVHIGVLERPTPMIFAILVLLGTVCVRLDRRPAILLGLSIAASLYVLGLLANEGVGLVDSRALIGVVWTGAVVGTADAVRSWRRYRASADAQLRSTLFAAEAQARQQVSEERLTIARELHDLLAHNLSVMNVQTGAALHLLRSDPDRAEEALTTARDAGRTVLDELRDLLAVLRHDEGDEAPTSSLPTIDELGELVEVMRSAGVAVTWHERGAPRPLAPAVSLAAYRIGQEALTNAAKHGNGAVVLETEWEPTGLAVHVANEVSGRGGVGAGHGLVGMRERATANGGRFRAGPVDGRFEVDAWLPAVADRDPAT